MSLINIIAGLFLMMTRAFVLSKLWAWFIVSLFTNVPYLPYSTAIGISLIFSVINLSTKYYSLEEINKMKVIVPKDRNTEMSWNIFIQLFAILSVFTTGWVLHLFM